MSSLGMVISLPHLLFNDSRSLVSGKVISCVNISYIRGYGPIQPTKHSKNSSSMDAVQLLSLLLVWLVMN